MTPRGLAFPILALAGLAPALAAAQPGALAAVEVRAVVGHGKRAADARPELPASLAPLAAVLAQTPYARFEDRGGPSARGAAGEVLSLEGLPAGYSVRCAWSEAPGGGLELTLTLLRKRPKRPPERVVRVRARVQEGGAYLLKCPGAREEGGDLLLVVRARRLDG
ncbi:MAG: hypothetical protein D6731_05710 [Planctomycetota bacterium]|nr:MAG: hypothetical protein D6731_05710 [Planctomycetota bacterium]